MQLQSVYDLTKSSSGSTEQTDASCNMSGIRKVQLDLLPKTMRRRTV